MKSNNANFYPPEGHDWVSTRDIRSTKEHNEALSAEKYSHDVSSFRQRLFGALIANNAIGDEGFGWAMYMSDDVGSVTTIGAREIVLISAPRGIEGLGEHVVPSLRIMTNEPVITNNAEFYYTEDITVEPNGDAQYLASGIRMTENDSRDMFAEDIKTSFAPLFLLAGGKLVTSLNMKAVTPVVNVFFPDDKKRSVRPYGCQDVMTDKIYALDKAIDILDSIADATPIGHYEIG